MSRILVIPDVHGIDTWKPQVKEALSMGAEIIFLGDYVDSVSIQGWEILQNLKNIIDFKKNNLDKVHLLLGNHDIGYVFGKTYTTGFNVAYWLDFRQIFNENWNLFDLAWGYQGKCTYTLLTHAGLTTTYYNELVKEINDPETVMHDILVDEAKTPWHKLPLHELLNYFKDQGGLLWHISPYRRGSNAAGSIIWADKNELIFDNYKGIDQIIGHTCSYYVETVFTGTDKLFFTDVHDDFDLKGFMTELQ